MLLISQIREAAAAEVLTFANIKIRKKNLEFFFSDSFGIKFFLTQARLVYLVIFLPSKQRRRVRVPYLVEIKYIIEYAGDDLGN